MKRTSFALLAALMSSTAVLAEVNEPFDTSDCSSKYQRPILVAGPVGFSFLSVNTRTFFCTAGIDNAFYFAWTGGGSDSDSPAGEGDGGGSPE